MSSTDTCVNFANYRTVTFEEQRKVWLELVPELGRLFDAMPPHLPQRRGTIRVYTSKVPDCPGALLVTVTVSEKRDGANYWWCDCECFHRPDGDLEQRGRQAKAQIEELRSSRAKVARAGPPRSEGSNVVSFAWYRKVFEERTFSSAHGGEP